MGIASAFQSRLSAAIDVQKTKENQVAGTWFIEDETRVVRSETVVRKSSRDPRNQIATMPAYLEVVTRAEVN